MIFASFLKTAADVLQYRQALVTLSPSAVTPEASLPSSSGAAIPIAVSSSAPFTGASVKVIVKIDSTDALSNANDLMREADGILVARGDLGVSLPMSKVSISCLLISRADQMDFSATCHCLFQCPGVSGAEDALCSCKSNW
jgi:hypothetical protein